MSKFPSTVDSAGAVRRALALGIAVFVAFAVAGGLLWLLGAALGLPRVAAFFLAACAGPLLVAGPILIWFLAQPLERRQRLLGIAPMASPAVSTEEDGSEAADLSPRATAGSGHPPGG
ncbi:MAG: hypothetical protein HPY64_07575 [Anaerolineae bacterium]|nr:hypothetical protein [Anaerolineae bacterium]